MLITPERQYELNSRVAFGLEVMHRFHPSSSWVIDVRKPDFSMRFLWRKAVRHVHCDLVELIPPPQHLQPWCYMASHVDPIAGEFDLPPWEFPVLCGWDLELDRPCPYQDLQYQFLTDLWRGAAHRHHYWLLKNV